jgi:hypothetical protein
VLHEGQACPGVLIVLIMLLCDSHQAVTPGSPGVTRAPQAPGPGRMRPWSRATQASARPENHQADPGTPHAPSLPGTGQRPMLAVPGIVSPALEELAALPERSAPWPLNRGTTLPTRPNCRDPGTRRRALIPCQACHHHQALMSWPSGQRRPRHGRNHSGCERRRPRSGLM